jgi:propionyl-CoA synthetase
VLNTCANALDLHLRTGRGEQPALVWESPLTGSARALGYAELQGAVARFAGALAALGVERGDRVLVYMPPVPEAVIGMLAAARLGAIHVVVSPGAAARELAQRVLQVTPKLILTASCGLEGGRAVPLAPRLEAALASVRQPPRCIVLERPEHRAELRPGRDLAWAELAAHASPAEAAPIEAKSTLYVSYARSATGSLRGSVRDHGGYAVALKWSLRHVFGLEPGQVVWADAELGGVVGHSYGVYAPLLLGCTSVLYEGGPPGTRDAAERRRVVERHRVSLLLTEPPSPRAGSPSAVRAQRAPGLPELDAWCPTETGWPIAAHCLGLASQPGPGAAPARPVPGFDVRVLGDDGHERARGEAGHLAIRLPLPPGCLRTLWQNDAGFERAYLERFPGYFDTGESGRIGADGGVERAG